MPNSDLSKHFNSRMWSGGGTETVSGAGSTLNYTKDLRPRLSKLVTELKVERFLDVPSGDYNWMRHVDLGGAHYFGMDAVPSIVEENRQRYGSPKVTFEVGDATKDKLPAVDLVMCRDLLLHLPFKNIADLFENLLKSEFKHILVTTYVNSVNLDIDRPGKARNVNLFAAPFAFDKSAALASLPDWIEGFPERYLTLLDRAEFERAAKASLPALREPHKTLRRST